MRRANGTGSVYKLSGNRRKPWIAVVVDRVEEYQKTVEIQGIKKSVPATRQIKRIVGYYKTKAEAEIDLALDIVMPSSSYRNITLVKLYEKWKKTEAYTELSKQTQDNYNAAYNYMKKFYKTKFADLRTEHFQKMIQAAHDKSDSTKKKIKTLAGILSEYAFSQDIVNKTYYRGVRIKTDPRKSIQTFNDFEIKKLFDNDSLQLVDTILILIYTGMRIRELLTLTKFSVDLENMLITGGVKTDAGKDRIIPIHPKIQKYIKSRYEKSETYLIEYEKEVGNKKQGTKRIINVPYKYEYYCTLYYEILEDLNIRRLTPHKARHTFFTNITAKCKDRKTIALIGGHTDPNFTDAVYVQPDIERMRRAIETL